MRRRSLYDFGPRCCHIQLFTVNSVLLSQRFYTRRYAERRLYATPIIIYIIYHKQILHQITAPVLTVVDILKNNLKLSLDGCF